MCEEYFDVKQSQLGKVHESSDNGSNTFENSPLASDSYCGFNKRQNAKIFSNIYNPNGIKSEMPSKRLMPSKSGMAAKRQQF